MGIAGDALLLGSANIDAPSECVISSCLGPVVDPLEMILCFFERAVALVDVKCISEIETAIAVDVEGRHTAGFVSAQIQTRDTCIRSRGRADAIGIDANTVTVEAETEVGDETRAEGVGGPERETLISRGGFPRKIHSIQDRPTSFN